jgi:hypothetical protein
VRRLILPILAVSWLVLGVNVPADAAPADTSPGQFTQPPTLSMAIGPYSGPDPGIPVVCGPGDQEYSGPVRQVAISRPTSLRWEPSFTGGRAVRNGRERPVGSAGLDVIIRQAAHVDINGTPDPGHDDYFGGSQWDQLNHLGPIGPTLVGGQWRDQQQFNPQRGRWETPALNRELAQIGQSVTFGRDFTLHPVPGLVVRYNFESKLQLGWQTNPVWQTCEAEVDVWSARDPNLPPGVFVFGDGDTQPLGAHRGAAARLGCTNRVDFDLANLWGKWNGTRMNCTIGYRVWVACRSVAGQTLNRFSVRATRQGQLVTAVCTTSHPYAYASNQAL